MSKILNSLSGSATIALLQKGKVGVLPTDTVYGLACLATNKQAVKRLYQLKSRENKPGTVVASNISQLVSLGLKTRYLKAVESFWPNPISILIPCSLELDYLDQGKRTLAVRISNNQDLNIIIDKTGPLLTTSANIPGEPPAKNISEAKKYFGDNIDFYMDGGDLSDQKPSTLIRVVDDAIEVLREGAVKIDEQTGRII